MYKVLLKSTTERVNFGNLGSVCVRFSNFVKSQECLEKALAIATEIGDRQGEGRLILCDTSFGRSYMQHVVW